jgi:hypothetical protein
MKKVFALLAAVALVFTLAACETAIPNSYRLVEVDAAHSAYPTFADAITADDLVEGINNAELIDAVEPLKLLRGLTLLIR